MTFKKGGIAWNKGLTKETDERIKKYAKKLEGNSSWCKGLTKETDERLAEIGRKVSITLKGRQFSEEHKRNLSETKRRLFKEGKLVPWMKGKKCSEEHKRKSSETRKRLFKEGKIIPGFLGKHHSEECKKKMSETKKRLYQEGKLVIWSKGKKLSKEHRERMSEIRKRLFNEGKLVIWCEGTKGLVKNSMKGFTYEEFFGKGRAKEIRKRVSLKTKEAMGRKEVVDKISKTWFKKGHIPWSAGMRGVTKSWSKGLTKEVNESLLRISKANKGKKLSEETKRKLREKALEQFKNGMPKETRRKISKANKGKPNFKLRGHIPWNKGIGDYVAGEKNPMWKGGLSFEPYGLDFNGELKERVRKRDSYLCQVCGVPQKAIGYLLTVHHIDYNKQNNEINNLLSLCKRCHTRTNHNRAFWSNKLQLREPIQIPSIN